MNHDRSYHVADGTAKKAALGTIERRVAERALEIHDLSHATPSFVDGKLFRCAENFPLPCLARRHVGQLGKLYGGYPERPPQIAKTHEAAI